MEYKYISTTTNDDNTTYALFINSYGWYRVSVNGVYHEVYDYEDSPYIVMNDEVTYLDDLGIKGYVRVNELMD